jgi:hypothetical protein
VQLQQPLQVDVVFNGECTRAWRVSINKFATFVFTGDRRCANGGQSCGSMIPVTWNDRDEIHAIAFRPVPASNLVDHDPYLSGASVLAFMIFSDEKITV